jgi:hypothetical protein
VANQVDHLAKINKNDLTMFPQEWQEAVGCLGDSRALSVAQNENTHRILVEGGGWRGTAPINPRR